MDSVLDNKVQKKVKPKLNIQMTLHQSLILQIHIDLIQILMMLRLIVKDNQLKSMNKSKV